MFIIIYSSVRLAISPLLDKAEKNSIYDQDVGLVKLRDIEVLSNAELEEIIELYHNKGVKEEAYEQYYKYANVLKELKEMGYFSQEEYFCRLDKLRKYFNVN